jgi:hypothetical protein
VVGVSDSRSLLVSDDVMLTGMDDEFLAKICRVKSAGSPLKSLLNLGILLLTQKVSEATGIIAEKFQISP